MSDYPMHGYLYSANGMHGPPVVLANREELHSFMGIFGIVALQDRLELLIVSGDDEDCYFHIKDGAVVYASGVEPQMFAQAIVNYHSIHTESPKRSDSQQRCRICGCTDDDRRQCIARIGLPCSWIEKDLCSACVVSPPHIPPYERGKPI